MGAFYCEDISKTIFESIKGERGGLNIHSFLLDYLFYLTDALSIPRAILPFLSNYSNMWNVHGAFIRSSHYTTQKSLYNICDMHILYTRRKLLRPFWKNLMTIFEICTFQKINYSLLCLLWLQLQNYIYQPFLVLLKELFDPYRVNHKQHLHLLYFKRN